MESINNIFTKRNVENPQVLTHLHVLNNLDGKPPEKLPEKLDYLKREESITNFMKFSWSWTL